MTRQLIFATSFLLSIASLCTAQSPPNIVLIFIDDMGYADIGPFGNDQVRTPHLDQFAKEGLKFTSFYATPVCSMSRACLRDWQMASGPPSRVPAHAPGLRPLLRHSLQQRHGQKARATRLSAPPPHSRRDHDRN